MKSKLTVNTLAFGNLRARKKQYTLMIAGIVLAMVFSSGVLFFQFCMHESIAELSRRMVGRQDGVAFNAGQELMDQALEAGAIDSYAAARCLGYINSPDAAQEKGALVAKYDEKARALAYCAAQEGRLPEKAGEIAIESDALVRMRLTAAVGDEITFDFEACSGDGFLPEKIQKTYTLVGILEDKRSNIENNFQNLSQQIPAAIVSEDELIEVGGKERYIYYYTYPKDGGGLISRSEAEDSFGKMYEFFRERNAQFVLTQVYSLLGEGANVRAKTALAAALAGVLMIASCVGIVNAFNTNLMERKKQIGMLRALGTTRLQIIKIFGREALIIAVITAPLSVLISYFGTKGVISLFGEDFTFIPKIWILVVCGVFGVICVMAAALIPLILASRISPMQAIRSIDMTRKLARKKIKTKASFSVASLIARRGMTFSRARMISVSVILAVAVITTSAGFSFVEYISDESPYFQGDYRVYRSTTNNSNPYQNEKTSGAFGLSLNEVNEILSSRHVESVTGKEERNICVILDEMTPFTTLLCLEQKDCHIHSDSQSFVPDITAENFLEKLGDKKSRPAEQFKEKYGYLGEVYHSAVLAQEAAEVQALSEHVIEGEINIDKINSGEEIILLTHSQIGFVMYTEPYFAGTYVTFGVVPLNDKGELLYPRETVEILAGEKPSFHAGDTVKLSLLFNDAQQDDDDYKENENPFEGGSVRKYDKEVKIGAVIERSDTDINLRHSACCFVTTHSGLSSFGAETLYTELCINLKGECTAKINTDMENMIESIISGTNFTYLSEYDRVQETERMRQALLTALISIILLMFCVSASVINNSLTARIRENKKEIGTLRAVGASASELTQSYVRQLLAMFGIGCTAGLGIYTIAFAAISIVCRVKQTEMPLEFDILRALAASLAMFALCGINLRLKINRQMKNSIVENIREL